MIAEIILFWMGIAVGAVGLHYIGNCVKRRRQNADLLRRISEWNSQVRAADAWNGRFVTGEYCDLGVHSEEGCDCLHDGLIGAPHTEKCFEWMRGRPLTDARRSSP